jgi:glucose-6-phosphate-specific signal transduction histidine kinase
MKKGSDFRVRLVLGCLALVYAILSKIFGWQGSKFAAEMAGIFLVFGVISWVASQGKKKEVTEGNREVL